jgi:hypothetical protein
VTQEPRTANTISGGVQFGPVLQGGEIRATFQLPAAAPVALAQLPARLPGLAGRDAELAVLASLLDPAGTGDARAVSVLAGAPGVGKTTLAVQAAHAAVECGWFRGGALFVDLRGYDEARVLPGQALDSLLRAMGVAAEHIPPTEEERAGLYRSILANIGRPVLVIVDNAHSEAQARPLLPGVGAHRVLVTSRHTLGGLGGRLIDLTVLGQPDAMGLLDLALRTSRPDDDRVSSDLAAAGRLAGLCGGVAAGSADRRFDPGD